MPTYAEPRQINCSATDHEIGNPMRTVSMPKTMSRQLVHWFLRESRNKTWKIVELSSLERKECRVPDGATVVEYPEAQAGVFEREFNAFCKRMEALASPQTPAQPSPSLTSTRRRIAAAQL